MLIWGWIKFTFRKLVIFHRLMLIMYFSYHPWVKSSIFSEIPRRKTRPGRGAIGAEGCTGTNPRRGARAPWAAEGSAALAGAEIWRVVQRDAGFFMEISMGFLMGYPLVMSTVCYWTWPLISWVFPVNMVIFQFAMLNYQRVCMGYMDYNKWLKNLKLD